MGDFWSDLQAWTQAEYNRISAAALAKRQKTLASDINRLLRDRITKKLTIKDGKGIAAEFLRTGGRIVMDPEPTPFGVIDHGWMAYTSPTLPASIYADTLLADYLAGAGTTIPGSSETDYLIGAMAASGARSCAIGFSGVDWSSPPTLDGSARYDSLAWASAAPANTYAIPHRHSGLGVAFAQALLGVGRKFADVLPSGWTYDPTTIGLARGPDRSYWLTKTDSAGCFLTKLTLPDAYYCLDYWLANNLLAGYPANLCLAIVLGNLILPESPTIYEAASATAMADVWADFAYDLTLWGWQWSDQRQGEDDEIAPKAILVTIHEVNPSSYSGLRCVSRTCRLTLNWGEDFLPATATLGIAESGQWRLNEFYLKVFRLNTAEDTLSRYDPQGGITFVTLDVEGPFAAWYGPDGSEIIAKWSGIQNYAGVSDSWTNPDASVCGLGTVVGGTNTTWSGDFAKKISFVAGGNSVDHYYSWGVTRGVTSYTAGDSGATNIAPGYSQITGCDGQIVTCGDYQEGDTWTINFLSNTNGGPTYALNYAESWNTFQSAQLVIAFGPPRTIWVQEEIIGDGGTWAKNYQRPLQQGEWQAVHSRGCIVPLRTSYYFLFYWTDDTGRNTGGTLDAGAVFQSSGKLFYADQVADLDPDLAWWDTIWALGGAGSTSDVPLAYVSRGSLAAYMSNPAAPTWEMPEGITVAAPSGTVTAWIGAA